MIMVILDGASEERIPELGNMTPMEYARTPFLDEMAVKGCISRRTFYPKGRKPDSLNCILSILGIDEKNIPYNRAYLEAVAADINIGKDEAVLRCNLVSLKDGRLDSFNGKNLTYEDMSRVSMRVKAEKDMKFEHLSEYRNLLVVKKSSGVLSLKDIHPHENVGMEVEYILENLNGVPMLRSFAERNRFTSNGSDYMFYPWGVSLPVKLPFFRELHHKSCSCVCSAPIVKGIAKAMKIDLADLKNATGDVDTDLKEKASAALRESAGHDVVLVHINGTDEASHRKDLEGKIRFIERIDSEFFKELKENLKFADITVLSDHQTSTVTGKHEEGCVDIIQSGSTKEGLLWQNQ